jgi:Prokaryotic membrane lipoprotein lipid attachment site
MKKYTFSILLLIAILSGCNSSKKSNELKTDSLVENSEASQMVGNDTDSHGCKASAGYTWSVLKNNCVRIFESGSQFNATGENKDSTMAAFVILNNKKDSAEVFLPNTKPIIVFAGDISRGVLFESKPDSVIIKFDDSNINIAKGEKIIFNQPKFDGIGKILGLK